MHWLSQRGFLSNGDTWGDILWLACNHNLKPSYYYSYYIPEHEVSGIYCFCRVSYYYYYYYIPEHEVSGIYCFCRVSYYYIPDHEVSGIYCVCSVSYYSYFSPSSSSFTWTCPYRYGKVFWDRKLKLGMSIDHVHERFYDPFWWKNSSPMGGFRGLKVGVVFVKNK